MARFYLDADVATDLARQLRHAGHDVLSAAEAGRRRAHDEEQLAYAASEARTLITHNIDDFQLLQGAWRHWADIWAILPRPTHAGILIVPQPDLMAAPQVVNAIDALLDSGRQIENRCYTLTRHQGWVQDR